MPRGRQSFGWTGGIVSPPWASLRAVPVRFDYLVSAREGAQHRVIEVKRHAEEDVEVQQPLRPFRHVREILHRVAVEGGQVRCGAGRIESLTEKLLRCCINFE
jgi:hypothetical protein